MGKRFEIANLCMAVRQRKGSKTFLFGEAELSGKLCDDRIGRSKDAPSIQDVSNAMGTSRYMDACNLSWPLLCAERLTIVFAAPEKYAAHIALH